MQLIPREILFDIQRNKHQVHLTENENSSSFKDFCQKASTTYAKTRSMNVFTDEMLYFMKSNVNEIRYINQGSSRIVFAMADGTALKMAKSNAGQAQNKRETEVCMNPLVKYACFPDFYDADTKNWLALNCELCSPALKSDFRDIFLAQPVAISNAISFIIKMKIDDWELQKAIDYFNEMENIPSKNIVKMLKDGNDPNANTLKSLLQFYRTNGLDALLLGDVEEIDNWGIAFRDNQKTLVIIDAGFNDDVYRKFYQRKHQNSF